MKVIETNGEKYIINMSEVASVSPYTYKCKYSVIIRLMASPNEISRISIFVETGCKKDQSRVINELAEGIKND